MEVCRRGVPGQMKQDPIQDTTLYLVVMSPQALMVGTCSDFFVFNNLESCEEHWLSILQVPLYWNLSDVSFMIILCLQALGKASEVNCHFHRIISYRIISHIISTRLITIDVGLDHLGDLEVVILMFLHCKVTFPLSLPYCTLQ